MARGVCECRTRLSVRTQIGIVTALLSVDEAKQAEGMVAVGVIENVTKFNIKIGEGGRIAQIDVGTQSFIIEVKKAGVSTIDLEQLKRLLTNDQVNPVGKDGQRMNVILYAPDYNGNAEANLYEQYGIKVARTWSDLRKLLGLE